MNNRDFAFRLSQPIDPLSIAPNYFSLDCLELSFQLLREQHPGLALNCQNLLADARQQHHYASQDKLIPLEFDVLTVSQIVTALSETVDSSVNDGLLSKDEMIAVHQTLLNWLMYAQSFLEREAR